VNSSPANNFRDLPKDSWGCSKDKAPYDTKLFENNTPILIEEDFFQSRSPLHTRKLKKPLYWLEKVVFIILLPLKVLVPCEKCSWFKIMIMIFWKNWRSPTPLKPKTIVS
jgi:hypothetical protein